jgi:tetratricopeptide (TPR) repeat protein
VKDLRVGLPGFTIACAILLSGCELLVPHPGQYAQVETRAPSDLELSRDAFSRGNYGIAIRHLELELARHPASTAALNGLGASYDQLGRHDVALRYFFRALALAPESAVTLNNIGYSYILQGSRTAALRYLELALVRDPEQQAARDNQRRALALEEPAALELFVSAAGSAAQLRPELQTMPLASPESLAQVLPASVRIEVSNGNGIAGMASRVRAALQQQGVGKVVRLTNADSYGYATSILYYRPGFRAVADTVAARLPVSSVAIVESSGLVDWVDLRLLIGRDLIGAVDMEKAVTLALSGAQHDFR